MIRLATIDDLSSLLDIYASAREYMKITGNPNQWNKTYPSREILISDINEKQLYVCYNEKVVYGSFVFFNKNDPTYEYIDGKWLNNDCYGVIHKVASNGVTRGVFKEIFAFCKQFCINIRIDTHKDNLIMQKKLDELGFKKCGIIYLKNGDPRLAYHYVNRKD